MDSSDNNTSSDFNTSLASDCMFKKSSEGGNSLTSKFWAAYKKISGEYDDNMIQSYNDNTDTLMLFAGLFSAVNTAFIIAMQPNPADTTNDLLVHFMQNAWNGSSVTQPVAFSAPVTYSSSKIWMQVLAYTSLTFSLLAAFGAVLSKQWLGYYKTSRFDGVRLEDRYQQRHRKFEVLDKWRFKYVLELFPILLQISLFLFILSLAAAMWIQHRIISFFIIIPVACGALFYICMVGVSLIFPDCPFQTPISLFIRYLLCIGYQSHEDSTPSAISWILDTSTDLDVLSLALNLMVTISDLPNQSQHVLSSSLINKVLDTFKACFDSTQSDKGNAVSFGRALIYISWKHDEATEILNGLTPEWMHWPSWRRLYLPRAVDQCVVSFRQMKEGVFADLQCQAKNMRTALRMVLGAGMDKFINPDKHEEYVELVWHGQFGAELNLPDVDWLMDCAKHFYTAQDFDAAGDALLLLSNLKNINQDSIVPFLNNPGSLTLRHCALRAACRAVDIHSPCDSSFVNAVLTAISPTIQHGHKGGDLSANAICLLELTDWPQYHPLVGSPLIDIQRLIFLVLSTPSVDNTVVFGRYYRALIHFMRRATSLDCKRAAVHVAYRMRRDLALITGTPSLSVPVHLQTEVLSTLSPALLTTVPCEFNSLDHFFYLRLIFTLASHPKWLPRLEEDGHIKRCIEITPVFSDQPPSSFFYLAGIFLRIEVASGEQSGLRIMPSRWWDLTKMAWHVVGRQDHSDDSNDVLDDSDGIDILEALVTTTKSRIPPGASASDLEFLRKGLGGTILKMESQQPPLKEIIAAMKDLKRYEPSRIISAVEIQ